MPIDMARYLGLFASEAQEHLEGLGKELLLLERGASAEAVDAMFRHAHSVKGMASSMGFEPIAGVAHRVEDLVALVRQRPSAMSSELADVLLAAVDQLQAMVRASGQGESCPDPSSVLDRLQSQIVSIAGKATDPAANMPESPPPRSPCAGEASVLGRAPRFAVKVKLSSSCPIPGARAFLVHKKLAALGDIFDLKPPLADLRAGRIPENVLSLTLASQSAAGPEAIRKALSVVADLDAVEVADEAEAFQPARLPEVPQEGSKPVGSADPARTVRVKTETLDSFLDAAGELLLATAHLRELAKAVPEAHRGDLEPGLDRLRVLVKDLHNKVMSVRMTPLSLITDRLPRAARDIARRMNREVDLEVTGGETELDRAILDELSDPLLHLLRNCIDHGIEDASERVAMGKGARGRIVVTARRDRDRVLVEFGDDGRGMDTERLKAAAVQRGLITAEAAASLSTRDALMLCCLPGLSTAANITDLSGRGVGMDAVKRAVEDVGGTLDIDTTPGRGTRFAMRLPFTVVMVNVLLVGVGREVFGLPIAKVKAVVEADPAMLSRSGGAPMLAHHDAMLPVHSLGKLLGIERLPEGGARSHVVLDSEIGEMALEVDKLVGQEEAILKALSCPLDRVGGLAGVTILGTGRPVFILDVPRLIA
jgi:two-component system chemotaxis sensor kinase CheA